MSPACSTDARLGRLNRLKKKAFGDIAGGVFRAMATLLVGGIAARTIGLVSLPILTRIYAPEDFGVLAIFTALVVMLEPFLTFRYVLALPLPRTQAMAINLVALCLSAMFLALVLISISLWAFASTLLTPLSMEVLIPWWWLIVLGLAGASLYEMMMCWATRQRAFKPIARTQVAQAALGAVVKIGLGLAGLKPLGLLIGRVVTTSVGTTSLARFFWSELRANFRHVKPRRMLLAARHYGGFPTYRLPSEFLIVFAMQGPLLFAAIIFDADTAGQLGLVLTTLSLPLFLLGKSMKTAYYAEVASVGRKNPTLVRSITYHVLFRMSIAAFPPSLLIFLFGPELFALCFGARWETAGLFASYLALSLYFRLVYMVTSQIFGMFFRNGVHLLLNVQHAALVTVCFGFGALARVDAEDVILIYSGAVSIHYCVGILLATRCISDYPSRSTRT